MDFSVAFDAMVLLTPLTDACGFAEVFGTGCGPTGDTCDATGFGDGGGVGGGQTFLLIPFTVMKRSVLFSITPIDVYRTPSTLVSHSMFTRNELAKPLSMMVLLDENILALEVLIVGLPFAESGKQVPVVLSILKALVYSVRLQFAGGSRS